MSLLLLRNILNVTFPAGSLGDEPEAPTNFGLNSSGDRRRYMVIRVCVAVGALLPLRLNWRSPSASEPALLWGLQGTRLPGREYTCRCREDTTLAGSGRQPCGVLGREQWLCHGSRHVAHYVGKREGGSKPTFYSGGDEAVARVAGYRASVFKMGFPRHLSSTLAGHLSLWLACARSAPRWHRLRMRPHPSPPL